VLEFQLSIKASVISPPLNEKKYRHFLARDLIELSAINSIQCKTLTVADLGVGPGPPPHPTPLILGKNEEMTKGRKAGRASKTKTSPLH